jgi:hypothetical protein
MIPTQRQIDLMDPQDAKQFPRKIRLTSSERRAEEEEKTEKQMHNKFSDYLRLRSKLFQFVHADPTKKSRIEPGWPDYTVICKIMLGPRPKPVACLIEFKMPGAILSDVQLAKFSQFERCGIPVYVCTSVGDAIQLLIEYFELPQEALE